MRMRVYLTLIITLALVGCETVVNQPSSQSSQPKMESDTMKESNNEFIPGISNSIYDYSENEKIVSVVTKILESIINKNKEEFSLYFVDQTNADASWYVVENGREYYFTEIESIEFRRDNNQLVTVGVRHKYIEGNNKNQINKNGMTFVLVNKNNNWKASDID